MPAVCRMMASERRVSVPVPAVRSPPSPIAPVAVTVIGPLPVRPTGALVVTVPPASVIALSAETAPPTERSPVPASSPTEPALLVSVAVVVMPVPVRVMPPSARAGAESVIAPVALNASGPAPASMPASTTSVPPPTRRLRMLTAPSPVIARPPAPADGEATSDIAATSPVSATPAPDQALHCATWLAPVSVIAPALPSPTPWASSRCAVMMPTVCAMAALLRSATVWPVAVTASPSPIAPAPASKVMPPLPLFASVPPALVVMPTPCNAMPAVAPIAACTCTRPAAVSPSMPAVASSGAVLVMPPFALVTCTPEPRTAKPGSTGEDARVSAGSAFSVTAPVASALQTGTTLAWPSAIDAA